MPRTAPIMLAVRQNPRIIRMAGMNRHSLTLAPQWRQYRASTGSLPPQVAHGPVWSPSSGALGESVWDPVVARLGGSVDEVVTFTLRDGGRIAYPQVGQAPANTPISPPQTGQPSPRGPAILEAGGAWSKAPRRGSLARYLVERDFWTVRIQDGDAAGLVGDGEVGPGIQHCRAVDLPVFRGVEMSIDDDVILPGRGILVDHVHPLIAMEDEDGRPIEGQLGVSTVEATGSSELHELALEGIDVAIVVPDHPMKLETLEVWNHQRGDEVTTVNKRLDALTVEEIDGLFDRRDVVVRVRNDANVHDWGTGVRRL